MKAELSTGTMNVGWKRTLPASVPFTAEVGSGLTVCFGSGTTFQDFVNGRRFGTVEIGTAAIQ